MPIDITRDIRLMNNVADRLIDGKAYISGKAILFDNGMSVALSDNVIVFSGRSRQSAHPVHPTTKDVFTKFLDETWHISDIRKAQDSFRLQSDVQPGIWPQANNDVIDFLWFVNEMKVPYLGREEEKKAIVDLLTDNRYIAYAADIVRNHSYQAKQKFLVDVMTVMTSYPQDRYGLYIANLKKDICDGFMLGYWAKYGSTLESRTHLAQYLSVLTASLKARRQYRALLRLRHPQKDFLDDYIGKMFNTPVSLWGRKT